MDIDVKNALDRALLSCENAWRNSEAPLKTVFAGDIYSFITAVSTVNGEERYELFNKLYLKGRFSSSGLSKSAEAIPESLRGVIGFCQKSSGKSTLPADSIILFFSVLGKYYSSSHVDRRDICFEEVVNRIKQMSDYKKVSVSSAHTGEQPLKSTPAGVVQKGNNGESGNEGDQEATLQNEPEDSLDELLARLNSLIGLEGVKKEVQQIINLIKLQKKGKEFGEDLPPLSLHLVFYGNPGTGKTTVARLLSQIYKCLGVLSTGQLIEVDRGGLVAGFVGQTALKTQEVIDKAMGGILFIDEAYSLTHGKGDNDFGQEAVDTILKAMEDHRDDFIVIVAGYPDLMKEFIASNPGLKSRFNQFINFEDYYPEELKQIFLLQCREQNLIVSADCEEYLSKYFEEMYAKRAADYANGRDVRNYFEKVVKARANRLAPILDHVTRDEFLAVALCDLIEAANTNQTM